MGPKILYAGDSPVGGAANYLLGVMKSMRAQVSHIPPAEKMKPAILRRGYDVILLSDYSKTQLDSTCENLVLEHVREHGGLIMIGGWGSFSGPFGKWKGSGIENVLPVQCKGSDDRTNFPGGASVVFKKDGGFLEAEIFRQAPVICGMNEITPKSIGNTLLAVRRVLSDGNSVRLEPRELPLLVVDSHPKRRVAALATDLAPHWCGGLVDWGDRSLKLPVTDKIQIEVGNFYVAFIKQLLVWLASRP